MLKEEFKDTKGVIRIRISKKNRQHNGQKKKYKRTNNDLQNIHRQCQNQTTIYKTYIDNVKTGSIITVLCEFEHAIKKRQKHKSYKQQK